jgi:hypothetical protein
MPAGCGPGAVMKAWKWIIKMPGGALVRTGFFHAMSMHAQVEANNAGGVLVGIDMSTLTVF